MGIIEIIATIGGLIIPPAYDFIKKKWIKGETDTPEATAAGLALNKPEALPGYVESMARLKDSETKYFNRDVTGTPSQWVIDMRAVIRPLGVVISFALLFCDGFDWMSLTEGARASCEIVISSWFGSRISSRG